MNNTSLFAVGDLGSGAAFNSVLYALFVAIVVSDLIQLFVLRFGEYYSNPGFYNGSHGATLHSPFHSCLLVLFLLHLLSAFFNILPLIIIDSEGRFHGGNLLCKLLSFLQYFFLFFTTFCLILLLVITHQYHRHRERQDPSLYAASASDRHQSHPQQLRLIYDDHQPPPPPPPIAPRTFQFSVKIMLIGFIAALLSLPQMLINSTDFQLSGQELCGPEFQLSIYYIVSYVIFAANIILAPLLTGIIISWRLATSSTPRSPSTSDCRSIPWLSERTREIRIALLFCLVHVACGTPNCVWALIVLFATDNDVLLTHGSAPLIVQMVNTLQYCIYPWLYFISSFSVIQNGFTQWKDNRNRVRLRRSICESQGFGDSLVASNDLNSMEMSNEADSWKRCSLAGSGASVGCIAAAGIGALAVGAAGVVGVEGSD